MLDQTPTQTAPRHGSSNQHLVGRHSAFRRGGMPVSTWVPVPPQYHGGRHRAGLLARLVRTTR